MRKIAAWIVGALFSSLLLTTAVTYTLLMVFGTPTHLKNVLKDSGVYDTFVDNVISESQKSSDKSSNNVTLNTPVVKKAAQKAFNPEFLQSSTENFLDGSYNWLNGKTKLPDFKIDLRVPKQQFAAGVAQAAGDRLAKLPVCSSSNLPQDNTDIDPFKIKCRPAGLNITAEKKKIINDLTTNKDFLGKPVLTAQSLPKNDKGQTFFAQAKQVPTVYKILGKSPIILTVLLLLLATALIFLHVSKRKGLRRVGTTLIVNGLFLALISSLVYFLIKNAIKPGGFIGKSFHNNNFQLTITQALGSLAQLINKDLIIFGAGYALLGIILVLATRFLLRPKTTPNKPTPNPGKSPNPN